MLLVIDSETSGLVKDDLDPLAPEQPHLVQLGARLYDLQWNIRGRITCLIKPDGWSIEPQAEAVHGISTGMCSRYGVSLAQALVPLQGMAGCAIRIIGHHVQFDRKVIAMAIHRAGGNGVWWSRMGSKMLCTMESSTKRCNLQGEFGAKFPSLEEAAQILTPELVPWAAHDVDADIDITVAVYRKLVELGDVAEAKPFSMELA